jgi:hypothetical protein
MPVWEQEFREFRWLLLKLSEAKKSGDPVKIAKAEAKFNDWRDKHPQQYLEIGKKLIDEGPNATIMVKRRVQGRPG